MIKNTTKSILVLLFSCLAGCSSFNDDFSIYKRERIQGNIITQSQVDQLKPGMNKAQVKFLLGSPMINDSFHQDRWDYVYWYDGLNGEHIRKRLTLFFKENLLHSLEGNVVPGRQ